MRFFVVLFFLVTYNDFSQSNDCTKFKIGTFKYANPEQEHFSIVRKDSIQIETDTKTGYTMTGKVEWLDKCKYKLTYIKVSNDAHSFIIGTSFNVDITNIKNNSYTFTAYDDTRKMDGEIVKIKQ